MKHGRAFVSAALGAHAISCARLLGGLDEGEARDAGLESRAQDAASDAGIATPDCGPWLDRTSHRVAVEIANAGPALSQYPLRISIPTRGAVAGGRMRSDGADLRVTQADARTIIPHAIQRSAGGDATLLWVRPDLGPGRDRLFVYYGDPSSASTADPRSVFVEGVIKNGRFDMGTVPWFSQQSTGSETPTFRVTGGGAEIHFERQGPMTEASFAWCQRTTFPRSRLRIVFDFELSSSEGGAAMRVWLGGFGGPMIWNTRATGVFSSVETNTFEAAEGETSLCVGVTHFASPSAIRRRVDARIADIRVRPSAAIEPHAHEPGSEETCDPR